MENETNGGSALIRQLGSAVDSETEARLRRETQRFMKAMTQYKCAMMDVEARFNLLNEEYMLEHGRAPVNSIKTRLKTLPSIREKLERKGIEVTPASFYNSIHDIAGVRVICAFTQDVYHLADALLRQDDITLLHRKDYISFPKPNGYRSMHLLVTTPIYLAKEKKEIPVEVQLRTVAMDCWASLEHQLRYKSEARMSDMVTEELLRCAGLSAELDMRMDLLGKELL